MTQAENPHSGRIYSIRNRNAINELSGLELVRFAGFAAGEQGLEQGKPVEVYVAYESAHSIIIESVKKAYDHLIPVTCGFVEFNIPTSATVYYLPARVLTMGTAYTRIGLKRVNATDDEAITATTRSIQRALTVHGTLRSKVPQINARVEHNL